MGSPLESPLELEDEAADLDVDAEAQDADAHEREQYSALTSGFASLVSPGSRADGVFGRGRGSATTVSEEMAMGLRMFGDYVSEMG